MIEPHWKRIGAFHLEDDGTVGAVWLAQDGPVVHCYDAALFRTEVPAIITEGIAARGRHYPFAWRKKDQAMADKLEDAGINMLPEPCMDDKAMAEVISRQIWQMLRTQQLRVERRVGDWLDEYKTFFRDNDGVPEKGFPLMAATRHAIEMIPYAEPERIGGHAKKNYPSVAVV